jgi:hypothetical protein
LAHQTNTVDSSLASLDFLLDLACSSHAPTPAPAMHGSLAPAMHGGLIVKAASPAPHSPLSGTHGPPPSSPTRPPSSLLSTCHAPTPPTPVSPTVASHSPPVTVHRPPSPTNIHTMQTHAKHGLFQPITWLNLSASHSTLSPIPKTYRGRFKTVIGIMLPKTSMMLLLTMALGHSYLVLHMLMLFQENGSTSTSSTLTAGLPATRLAGSFAASVNSRGLTSMRLSALSSSRPRSASSSASLSRGHGQFTS